MTRGAANDDAPPPAAGAMTLWDRETGALTIAVTVDVSAALATIERESKAERKDKT